VRGLTGFDIAILLVPVLALALLPVILIGNRIGLAVSRRISDPTWRAAVEEVLAAAAADAVLRGG
jgi:uncharacterized membrane protein YfcA